MVLLAEACFGCKATSLPMKYLGLQITLSPPAPSFWNGVEQKLTDRLQCWQEKLLSLPGRLTLAKHCLASVPLHALVVFRPPVAVLRRFDKLIRKFIWNGDRPSDRLAHWDVVAFPRLLGGAGRYIGTVMVREALIQGQQVWMIDVHNYCQSDFCKFDTKFDAAKAAEPPAMETRATTTCTTTSNVFSSGTKKTQRGPKSSSPRLRLNRAVGVPGSVAADRTPNSSAFESKPSFSTVESDSPNFSAADSKPAFSALLNSLNSCTLDRSLTGDELELS
ncbi:putative ribonuclease H protein [Nymphaea thermarum]|nr:putative ribonuclease H protein [Nymphaea thermarum]